MTISWSSSTADARWLGGSAAPWWQVITFGPADFTTYARVRFIPDPVRPGQAEADVEVPDDHPSDLEQTRAALRVLARFTSTPQDCWFAVWEGYAGSIDIPAGLPLLDLPHRRYGLLRGDLAGIEGWEEAVGSRLAVAPAFVWPSDRSWCWASDVDPHWAGVGAAEPAVRALLDAPGLDVVRADPTAPQPAYS